MPPYILKYLFWFSINIYLCVCCCFAWDANVGCICLSWTCWGWGGWGWRWDCWWGWGTCWGCGTCCRTCCGCCCCCCGCWGRCSTTTSRWISASDVLRSEIKSSCNRKSRKFCQTKRVKNVIRSNSVKANRQEKSTFSSTTTLRWISLLYLMFCVLNWRTKMKIIN